MADPPKSLDDIVATMLGQQLLQIARLQAQYAQAEARIRELESGARNVPQVLDDTGQHP